MDGLILNAGVRHDDFETFGDTTNPRAALIYSPVEKTTIKAIYGNAFRAPSVFELYFNDGGATQRPSPNLKPETIDTYELVFEQYIGDHLLGSIAAFHNTIEDLIQQDVDLNDICDFGDPCLIFRNVEEVVAQGIELELEGKWKNGYAGKISYTYQETEDKESGDRLTNSPRSLAKANITIPIFRDKVFLGIEEQYTGERETLASNEVDEYFVTNVTLFSQDLLEGLEASASVYNLFDETYHDPGAGEHAQDEIEQDGITYRFKLTYKF
jgi:iron complex outermembrane receptor protein